MKIFIYFCATCRNEAGGQKINMKAIQVVTIACQTGNLASAIEAHEVLLSTANRASKMIQNENCSTDDYAYAQRIGVQLHEVACMIQSAFDVDVAKFPTL